MRTPTAHAQPSTADNLYWLLLQVAIRSKHKLMQLADVHGLTVMQLYTLCSMELGQARPMHFISGLLACDASNVTGIVDRLLMGGYIVREEKPEDRRVKMIALTSAGEALKQQLLTQMPDYEIPDLGKLTAAQHRELQSLLLQVLR